MDDLGSKPRIAVVGASGLVGSALIELLAKQGWPADKVIALASAESVGKRLDFGDTGIWVDDLASVDFSSVDVVVAAVPEPVCSEVAAQALAANSKVVSCFAGDALDGADCVLPIMGEADARGSLHVQLPHPAAFAVGMLLDKLKDSIYIQHVSLTAMQPVSSFGSKGMKTLASEAVGLLSGTPPDGVGLGCQMAFNLVSDVPPGVSVAYPNAVHIESQVKRLFGDEMLPVQAGLMTTSVFFGTAIRLELELSEALDVQLLQARLQEDDWFRVGQMSASVVDAVGDASITVCDLRFNDETSYRLSMWLLVDNVKTAAARNALELCKVLQKNFQ